jgi:hypothetical protein
MKIAIEGNALATHMLVDLGIMYFMTASMKTPKRPCWPENRKMIHKGCFILGRTQMELGRVAEAKKHL